MDAQKFLEDMGPVITGMDDPNIELLAPELRNRLVQFDGGMLMIKHPWVNQMLPMVGQANMAYKAKFSMAREYLSQKKYHAYFFVVVERPWRMTILENWWVRGKLTAEEARELLIDMWQDTELPSVNLNDPIFLFSELGFLTDDEEGWNKLPDTFTIYRGGSKDGISWTLNKDIAKKFNNRVYPEENRQLWKAEATKEEVLAYFTGRSEEEIVIDPYWIDVEEIK